MAEVEKDIPLSFDSPESSSVQGASYDPATMTLTVTLKPGKIYTYNPISPEKWKAFHDAPSKGKFFQGEIRPKYIGRRK
jgi:hypothetical protein